MAFETGSATNMADLITKLFTFAVANGWTQDQLDTGTGKAAMHRGNIYVSFRWNTTTPLNLGLYQALGYTGGNDPGTHPNDSGNGAVSATNATIDDERYVDLGNGAFPSYHFFEYDTYIHIVVERTTDIFRHFGFGSITKFGDWTGGEYCYGMHQQSGSPIDAASCYLADGLMSTAGNRERSSTLHAEGLPGQSGSSKWGEISGFSSAPSNDTAGNSRILVNGGFRGSPVARQFGLFAAGNSSGLIPTYPIALWYQRLATSDVYFLGTLPDVRGVNIGLFVAKQEITIGSDTWIIFPAALKTTTSVTDRTRHMGIAYKKVTI